MRKAYLYLLLITVLFAVNTNLVTAAVLEKGNPTAVYAWDTITLSNGEEIKPKGNYIALFVDGTLIADYDVLTRNDRALVPVEFISLELSASVDWDEDKQTATIQKDGAKIVLIVNKSEALVNGKEITLDCPAIIYNEIIYVPLRFIAENLGLTISYAHRLDGEFTYYYDTKMPVSPAGTLIRDFPNIIIDEKYDLSKAITKDEAMKAAKEICMEGLENFKKITMEKIINSGGDPERSEFKSIETEINRMLYLGEVSRYYKFTIGPYDILYNKYNNKMFFQIYSSSIIVKEVDVNDPGLFMPVFIVG